MTHHPHTAAPHGGASAAPSLTDARAALADNREDRGMTDTPREAVRRFLQRLNPRDPRAAYGALRSEACATITALLTRAEAAEAERDRQYDENVHRIAEHAKAEAERDALQAKLAMAVEALAALMDLNDNGGPFGGEMYHDRIERAWDKARATLATLTADTPKEGKDDE